MDFVADMTPRQALELLDKVLAATMLVEGLHGHHKAGLVRIGIEVRDMASHYQPRPHHVARSHQFAMAAGAPEAEQHSLLGRTGG